MASLIAENNYLIPDSAKRTYAPENKHLIVITNLDVVDNEFEDPIRMAIGELSTNLDDYIGDLDSKIEHLTDKVDKMNTKVISVMELIEEKLGKKADEE